MEDLFNRVLDRTRSRLDIPVLRTIFGLKARAHHNHWTAVDRDNETLRIGMHALFDDLPAERHPYGELAS